MNRKIKSVLSVLISASFLSNIPLAALSYTGIGEVTDIYRDTIAEGLRYSQYKAIDADAHPQEAYILEYKSGKGILPLISYGEKIYGMDRLGGLVNRAENDGFHVHGAINGDFYSMQTGVPMGIMIDGGKLISTDDGKYAVGFLPDGNAIIGNPSVSITMTDITKGGEPIIIDQFNKLPTIWGVYINTDSFSATNMSPPMSKAITVSIDGDFTLNSSLTGIITAIDTNSEKTPIPEGHAVISIADTHERYPLFGSMEVGDSIKIDITCTDGWSEVETAIGGGDIILKDGVMPEGIINEAHEKTSNPRTAVGIKANGDVIFFAVNGRSDTSRGLKLEELSALMSELGCVTALNLDGGGSTTVMTRPPLSGEIGYVTSPIDSSYRALANGILFVSKYTSDGVPSALSVSPYAKYLLRGSSIDFSAKLLDSTYTPTGGEVPSEKLSLSFAEEYPSDIGTISEGRFTAGYTSGEYFFNVSHADDPTIDGETSIIVTDKLDSLELNRSSIKVLPGSLAEIDIIAEYGGKRVICDSNSFYYTLNGTHVVPKPEDYPNAAIVCDLGYLDKEGRFQAFGGVTGQVELGVWFDQFVRYVTINISDEADIISDFETEEQTENFTLEPNSAFFATVKGYKSDGAVGIAYSYTDADIDTVLSLKPNDEIPLIADAESIKIFVEGEISGFPAAILSDEEGNEYVLSYNVTKDYSKQLGWREMTAIIPDSLKTGTMSLSSIFAIKATGSGAGAITIDNPHIYYGKDSAPEIVGIENHWSAENLYTLYDMTVIERSDCEITENSVTYAPDKQLTRGEFAKMLVRYMGIDTEKYLNEGVLLEDTTPADKIPYIRAAIDAGLMGGRGTTDDGIVIFDAGATITREEAFKVFGSIIDATEVDVPFADSGSISVWALSGIAKCVSVGLIHGYDDNTLRPKATISRGEMAALLIRTDH